MQSRPSHSRSEFREIDAAAAERLIRTQPVHLLDVRTPGELVSSGHIPGATLLPLSLIASAPAILPRDGTSILVYCAHGIRSRQAAHMLVQAGFESVLSLTGGLACWNGAVASGSKRVDGPSGWFLENAHLLRGRAALDVACGRGRYALLLAAAGWRVHAVDRDAAKIDELQTTADRLGLDVSAQVVDLETSTPDLGEQYDLIVVMRYLHRPLFPALRQALVPGGLLVYETFTIEQAARGRPRNPDFLLQPRELRALVTPLEIVREREGLFDEQAVSGVVARKPSPEVARSGDERRS